MYIVHISHQHSDEKSQTLHKNVRCDTHIPKAGDTMVTIHLGHELVQDDVVGWGL